MPHSGSTKEKFDSNVIAVKSLIRNLVDDPDREGLQDTPRRVAKAWQQMTNGYHQNIQTAVGKAIYAADHDDLVVVRDVEFYSLCEHHLLPFFGKCHVGYVPNGKIVGLSKVPRIVEIFARRLQVQEKLSNEIGKALAEIIQPKGVAVVIEAHHLCMKMRGVQKQQSFTVTSSMLGCFKDDLGTRSEFISFLRN